MSYKQTGVLQDNNVFVTVFHAYVTTLDVGKHMRKLKEAFEKLPVPSDGRTAFDNWLATGATGANYGLCCIFSDGVVGDTMMGAAGCTRPTEAGAHVYDTANENASAYECIIIPTCNYHNHSVGNTNRGQNWGEYPTPLSTYQPQKVKPNTPFIVKNIKAAVITQKGQGKGHFPHLTGHYVPEARDVTATLVGKISKDIHDHSAHSGIPYNPVTRFLDPATGNFI